MTQTIDNNKENNRVEFDRIPRDHATRDALPRGTREAVAERIKLARHSLALTQKEAAEKSNRMPLPSYKGYEAGLKTPGGEAIQGLMMLGINANWLLTGEGEMLLNKGVTLDDVIFGRTAQRLAEDFAPNAAAQEINKGRDMPTVENDITRSIKMAKETAIKGGLDLTVDQRLEMALYIHNQLCDRQLDKAGFLMGMLDLVNNSVENAAPEK